MTKFLDWMPVAASDYAKEVDWINLMITTAAAVCIFAVTAAMLFFAWIYRRRAEREQSAYITHNYTLELLWTAIPTVVVIAVFYFGTKSYVAARTPVKNALEVQVTGYQWGWDFLYTTGKKSTNELVVPVNTPVRLVLKSRDVNHSFFVPALRLKEDVLAGAYHYLWFTATRIGEYPVFCTEYCGLSHAYMQGKLRVVSQADYASFSQIEQIHEKPVHEAGQQLFAAKGCMACHSVDGTPRVGPTLKAIFGREEKLVDGSKIVVDENYLAESLKQPNAKIAEGFPANMMPSFEGQLSEQELEALIAYLKTL